jgi:hypothetical protein
MNNIRKNTTVEIFRAFCISLLAGGFCLAPTGYAGAEEGHKEAAGETGHSDQHAEEEGEGSRGEAAGAGGAGQALPLATPGAGKAVEGYEHGKRIKLSEKARDRLGIRTGRATWAAEKAVVPAEAVVCINDRHFVFVARKGWYEYRPVKIAARDGKNIVLAAGLGRREDMVLKGAWTLRVIELDLEAGEKGGEHSH